MNTFRIPKLKLGTPPGSYNSLCVTMAVMAEVVSGIQPFQWYTAQLLIARLLPVTPRLETLLLQIPVSDDHSDYHILFKDLELHTSRDIEDARWDQPRPLQHLETLLLQGDPEMVDYYDGLDDGDIDQPETWGAHASVYRRLWLQVPRLKTLEVSCDDGLWENQDEPDDPNAQTFWFMYGRPFLGNIRHIYLHNSCGTCFFLPRR